jgi:hypothetical protein
VEEAEVTGWFEEYLDVFAACGRGERHVDSLLAYYGVPLLFTGDDGYFALTRDDQVRSAVQRQVDGMPRRPLRAQHGTRLSRSSH